MIKVSVLYPNTDTTSFDMNYYCNSHMPMVKDKLGAACTKIAVAGGLGGAAPESPPVYVAMGHLYFDTVDDFQSAFAPHAEAIMGDIPNYTNVEPIIQVSEIHI